nr:LysR substrate-binding domain-containing protein [Corynebacterium sp. CNJ-954]
MPWLRVLRELHRRQTLVAVAEALSYSTSAVSQQLRQLEKDIGVALVEPVGRRLALTPQGRILAEHAEVILAQIKHAEADVLASTGQPRGSVTVAGFQSAALTLIPRMIIDLNERYPAVNVVFRQGEPRETIPALLSADVDVVITESYPGVPIQQLPGITITHLMSDPLWLTMASSVADRLDGSQDLIGQLKTEGWAVENANTPPRTWVTNQCRRAGFEPRIVCTSEDLAVQANFVASGHAVALLPGLALTGQHRDLRQFSAGGRPEVRNVLAAHRDTGRSESAVDEVVRSLKLVAEGM